MDGCACVLKTASGFPSRRVRMATEGGEDRRMGKKKKDRLGRTLETKDIPHQLLFITQRQQITAQPLINYFSIITSSVKSVHDQA